MYLYIKAFHLIFMVTWFAGLFYLFRLFVYHVESDVPAVRDQLKIMERKLFKFTTPLMVLNIVFGLSLAYMYTEGFKTLGQHPWLYIKMFLVALLVGYHHYCGRVLRQLKEDRCKLTSRQCRFINLITVLFLFTIIFMATLKPGG
jgi:putative membrane protein